MRHALLLTHVLACIHLLLGCADEVPPVAKTPNLAQESIDGPIPLSGKLRSGPPVGSDVYRRCGTLGGEMSWSPVLSPDGRRLAARTNTGTIRLIDTGEFREIVELAAPTGIIDALSFSPDGRTLATLSNESELLVLWNADNGEIRRRIVDSRAAGGMFGSSLAFSGDGKRLLVSGGMLIDLETGSITTVKVGKVGSPVAMHFLAGNQHALVHAHYRPGSSNVSSELAMVRLGTDEVVPLFQGWSSGLGGFAVSPDGARVAVANSNDDLISIYEPGMATARVQTQTLDSATALAFSPDGAHLYAQTSRGLVVRDAENLEEKGRFVRSSNAVLLGVSPSGSLVTAEKGQTVWLNPADGSIVRTVADELTAISFATDGDLTVAAGKSALLRALREPSGLEVRRVPPLPIVPLPAMDDPAADRRGRSGRGGLERTFVATESADASIHVTVNYSFHWSAVDWYVVSVVETKTKRVLIGFAPDFYQFQSSSGESLYSTPIAALSQDGRTLYTLRSEEWRRPYIATWCRDDSNGPSPEPSRNPATRLP